MAIWRNGFDLRAALSALLMLVVSFAPIQARFVMAAHGHEAAHAVTTPAVHDHVVAHTHHDHDHSKTHIAAGEQRVTADSSGIPPHGHDHSKVDGDCCGTFCHSACVNVAEVRLEPSLLAMTFEQVAVAAMAATDPAQLQRPPSHLLSI